MEVRAGEVSKGITVREPRLINLGRSIAEALVGAYGALNIQCFMDETGMVRIFEINSRFGGGYPLAHQAGARFTDWLLDELDGRPVAGFDGWTDDLAMLRYDDAVFVPGYKVRECNLESAPSSTSTTHYFSNGTTFAAASKQ
jgi:carbamoyl-phosphate synthase large subunit